MAGAAERTALALKRSAPLHDGTLSEHIKPLKAAELVAQRLRAQIIRGELGEEDVLPSESALMERFNVSRPTLREAFRVLEAENLISIRRGARGGAEIHVPDNEMVARYLGFVLEFRGTTVEDVYTARGWIEVSAVRKLALKHTKADIAALRKRQAEIEELSLPQPMRFAHNSLTFHQLAVELTGNQTFAVLSGVVNAILLRSNESVTRTALAEGHAPEGNAQAHAEHARLIDLIEEKDADGAEALWRNHCGFFAATALAGADAHSVLDLLDR
jgi:DNA-binding FadR family transcriptional regulator